MKITTIDARLSILTAAPVCSPEECEALVAQAEAIGFYDAPITTRSGPLLAPEVRNNTRVMFDDVDRAKALWEIFAPIVPQRIFSRTAVGLNERLRIYRYQPGQRFFWHRDGSFDRSRSEGSLLSLLVYLNEGFIGGETEFDIGERLSIRPETGMALLFQHTLRHQGALVRSGVKYVLRTDVMYRDERAA